MEEVKRRKVKCSIAAEGEPGRSAQGTAQSTRARVEQQNPPRRKASDKWSTRTPFVLLLLLPVLGAVYVTMGTNGTGYHGQTIPLDTDRVMNARSLLASLVSVLEEQHIARPALVANRLYKALLPSQPHGVERPNVLVLSGDETKARRVITHILHEMERLFGVEQHCIMDFTSLDAEQIYNIATVCQPNHRAVIALHGVFDKPPSNHEASFYDVLEGAIDDTLPRVRSRSGEEVSTGHVLFLLSANFNSEGMRRQCTAGSVDLHCAEDEVRESIRFMVSDRFNQRVKSVVVLLSDT